MGDLPPLAWLWPLHVRPVRQLPVAPPGCPEKSNQCCPLGVEYVETFADFIGIQGLNDGCGVRHHASDWNKGRRA
jgi:hypothetical protein